MLKKLLVVPFILGAFMLSEGAYASEIKDITELQNEITEVSNIRESKIRKKKELIEEKIQEETVHSQTKTVITQKRVLRKKEPMFVVAEPIKTLEESNLDSAIEDVTFEIISTDMSVETLEKELEILTTYSKKLDAMLKGLEYSKDNMTKNDLVNKLSEVEGRISLVEKDSTEVEDTSKEINVLDKLDSVKKNLVYDIENYETLGEKIVSESKKYLGIPYVWGGRTPSGFDCSGFTQYVYKQVTGKDIGSWTVPQESSGTIRSVNEAEVGDLLFWGGLGGTHHVGIYIGGGQFIHAPTTGDVVKITNLTDFMPSFSLKVF